MESMAVEVMYADMGEGDGLCPWWEILSRDIWTKWRVEVVFREEIVMMAAKSNETRTRRRISCTVQ